MTTTFEGIRDIAKTHPIAVVAGLVVAVPGSFLLVTGKSVGLYPDPFASPTHLYVFDSTATPPVCTVRNPLELALPTSGPSDGPAGSVIDRIIDATLNNINAISVPPKEGLGTYLRHQTLYFPFARLLSVVVVTALPGAFQLTIRHLPESWASRHQTLIANVLHFIAVVRCANRRLEASDLLVVVFVMVGFDVFQRVLGHRAAAAMTGGESDDQPQRPCSSETPGSQTHSVLDTLGPAHFPKTTIAEIGHVSPVSTSPTGASDTKSTAADSKDREIVRLQHMLTESKTAHKAKEVQLRATKEELHSARETLNETFSEYSSLRNELKTVKQNLGGDHQAVAYRKDIELFALRKGNEQKERYIHEREEKLQEMVQLHRATVEVKDAQLKVLKERLLAMEKQSSPKFEHEPGDGDHALEVRLLRVKKARTPPDAKEDKDIVIARLQEQLAATTRVSEEVVNQQAELQRAWDIAKKIQKALKEERELHTKTREQLQETTVKLSEAESVRNRADSMPGRLPTIAEDEHDKNELGAMFDTAQEDNLRLYAEVAALEKRLSEANTKMFAAIKDAEALRELLRLEKAINEDMETARPSVVHRVHFQRMEGQLNEAHDALTAKDEEIDLLRNTIAEKDHYVKDIQSELTAATAFHSQDQDEIERLKQSVTELQTTKHQLMLDHERLASHRTRQRVISLDRTDRTSARSSGATLIQELSPPLMRPSNEPPPVEPMPVVPEREGSIQNTPIRHLRSKSSPKDMPNRWSLISNDIPPPELRELKGSKRRSLGLKEMMKSIVRKDADAENGTGGEQEKLIKKDESRIRRVLGSKDKNAGIRPTTATARPATAKPATQEAVSTPLTSPLPAGVRPANERRSTPPPPRYYATQSVEDLKANGKEKENDRPQTAVTGDPTRPKSRLSWGATNKLKRRTLM
ncbi:hypothetical protein BDW02DRAFT_356256 [Decorospora gaudefroyi]|uniref:Uncharacterized protein n=1 Tax=Decorospora gaudefroyi TaxID=184978 RepID=A0A6A5KKA7_9PLEO|nr:hypothetical protein BDW02DRAFT_356256 [Decorospora gaudefroyi]